MVQELDGQQGEGRGQVRQPVVPRKLLLYTIH